MAYTFDGFKDSQTNLLMPAAFYDALIKALATARRGQHPLTLLKFLIPNPQDGINFAQMLVENSRADDLIARMGEVEFLVLLVNSENGDQFFLRLHNARFPSPAGMRSARKSISSEELIAAEPGNFSSLALHFLEEIDREPHT